jgi:NDP-4-keto-2,6-dideoxyhexose 3-C-methyltransferase
MGHLYKTRTTCRICEGNLTTVLDLGDICISTFVDYPTAATVYPSAPIELCICDTCRLFQLRHTVDSSLMYSDYWYQSGLNNAMVLALKDIVDNLQDRIFLSKNDNVVDIGANDGTLLSFYPDYVNTLAIEPSNLYTLAFNKAKKVLNDYFSAKAYYSVFDHPAKIITAIAMFYDLEDPHSFVEDLRQVLDPHGILVIQMMDLVSMLKTGDFPNLCHEHLEYYSLSTLKSLLAQHSLEIFDLEYNKVNGGSLRVYVQHKDYRAIAPNVFNALTDEEDYMKSIGNPADYFNTRINDIKTRVVDFIKREVTDGQIVAVMGASTKGNTLLQYFGLDYTWIDCAAEVNKDKFGKYTVGTSIPIHQDTYVVDEISPAYYLILPWGFLDNFIINYRLELLDGAQFIVPLPEPMLVYIDDNGNLVREILE